MEYCRYGSAASFLSKCRTFTEEEIRDIMACCVIGLLYLHSKCIVHRVAVSMGW